ncbi:MAG: indole-3-glycerol phosphate synthase TrpC [Desulfobacterales bacterium]|nr:indole-3-glycerol phosphate synthase TrpC [Desulfobacterales bacterium]MDD4071842.1 indole-3-glycerol phosphate synthase TrpC [Desulfobacterales bacterium]MDD4392549.1 indole-3-glycerol phosphate synthase TrpC [Desulfobacterales bacterium]
MATDILQQIVDHKFSEIKAAKIRLPEKQLQQMACSATHDQKSLFNALQHPTGSGSRIIAEIKRASPSKGIIRPDLDPAFYATAYEQAGASAISVLTEERFFLGSCNDLKTARNATTLPILRKDFIISTYQLYESVLMGADAVLLIVRILSRKQLDDCLRITHELGMDALVEVHSETDLEAACLAGARLIGINNRNLKTFETDIRTSMQMVSRLQSGQVPVAASGIHTRKDLRHIRQAGIANALIGESIVRAEDPGEFIKHLLS